MADRHRVLISELSPARGTSKECRLASALRPLQGNFKCTVVVKKKIVLGKNVKKFMLFSVLTPTNFFS